jgi:hypothetical protein
MQAGVKAEASTDLGCAGQTRWKWTAAELTGFQEQVNSSAGISCAVAAFASYRNALHICVRQLIHPIPG